MENGLAAGRRMWKNILGTQREGEGGAQFQNEWVGCTFCISSVHPAKISLSLQQWQQRKRNWKLPSPNLTVQPSTMGRSEGRESSIITARKSFGPLKVSIPSSFPSGASGWSRVSAVFIGYCDNRQKCSCWGVWQTIPKRHMSNWYLINLHKW